MTTHDVQPASTERLVNIAGAVRVRDEPQCISPHVAPGFVGGPREPSIDGVTDAENMKMQTWWNRAMCREMKIPEGYQSVAVLMIKWTRELDQLKSEDEVGRPIVIINISLTRD